MIAAKPEHDEKADFIEHKKKKSGQDMQNVLRTRFMRATVLIFLILFGITTSYCSPCRLQL